ncbi:hypothetical protein AN640_05275 [Candidatus Epulonipiscium fishelsonii]|uniref:Uncharacterized protein n=1 Tax=Candidatus Epulonipiscium fishelsonii TaxID=77094 RepID=A0ACC8XI91_9FIRM|nr:hypothetical protein AN640_05275 [Epulopiscium sp. SCG-D08WGA-EpuloA1]
MKYNNKKTEDSHFLNIRNCAGYGFDTRSTNSCPPKTPWWDDGKYPDLEDFGNMYNPWLNPWYGPQTPMPLNEFVRPRDIDETFTESYTERYTERIKDNDYAFRPYPGENRYDNGFTYNPYFPYFLPEKEEPKHKKHKCCCNDDWECADDWFEKHYYGRCNK